MIINVEKEKEANYISFNNEVYANAPDFIKEMAKNVNKEYQRIFNQDFFTFIDETDIWGDDVPPEVEKLRKDLEKQYNL